MEVISKEIESCDTIEGLRHVYKKHITHKEEILPKLQIRKQEIEQLEQQMIDSKNID